VGGWHNDVANKASPCRILNVANKASPCHTHATQEVIAASRKICYNCEKGNNI